MAQKTKLHTLLPTGTELAVGNHATKREIYYKKASGLPTLYYPDGSYCPEANSWMIEIFRTTNFSLRGKGGTFGQYAYNLAPLLRYIHFNRIHPIEMTNSRFEAFIMGLSTKRSPDGALARSPNTVRAIGSIALQFLSHVGELNYNCNFLGKDGEIKAVKVDARSSHKLRHKAKNLVWYHPILPTPSPEHRRYPIGDETIKALNESAYKRQRSLAKRSKVMLSVFEHTGARRGEGAALLVQDILRAFRSKHPNPLVRLITFKRRASHFRYVPVPKAVIAVWVDYINTTRKKIMLRNRKLDQDHGYMFINHRNGAPLNASTISNEFHDLKVAANLDTPAHAHLFRHRFITNKLKMLIMQFEFDNQDAFRRALLDISGFKQKIQEWTGHISIESLERYIHLACKEITQEAGTIQNALLSNAASETVKYYDDLLDQLDEGHIEQAEFLTAMRTMRDQNQDAGI